MLLGKALLTVGGVVPGGVLFRSENGATVNTTTSYTVTVPQGVTSVAALAIGAGGGGGGASSGATAAAGGAGGGALSYSNSIAVTPGESLTINIPNQSANGAPGTAGTAGGDASILRSATTLLLAQGGRGSAGVTGGTAGTGAAGGAAASGVGDVKQSGGAGGNGTAASDLGGGGGGAAGYSGTGGAGGSNNVNGSAGTGGGGGGGANYLNNTIGGPGGGVLWYGQGSNGAGGAPSGGAALNGGLGSSIGGRVSVSDVTYAANSSNMIGLPGAGGPGAPSAGSASYNGGRGAGGAVRILWNNTFDWAAPLNVTSNTITIPEYTTSATANIVTPQVQLGDTLYFVDYAMGATLPAAVTPSGFTLLGTSQTGGTTRFSVYYRQVLSYAESGVTLTGATGSTIMSKFLVVVRGTGGAAIDSPGCDARLGPVRA
jgi:hypothetical protein